MTTYAVHLPDGGTSEYSNVNFTSVCELGGVLYAVRSDGLYALSGETDNTVEIVSNVGLGYTKSEELGALYNVYVETNISDKLTVAVHSRQGTFEYPTRSSSEDQRIQRADIGKGLRENAYYVFIRSLVGTVFNVSFNRAKGKRRI